jgi:rubrerythrin
MNQQLEELLCQALETEMGGVLVYRTALTCVTNEDLAEEWRKYLEETERHVQVVREVFQQLGLDPEKQTAGRRIVREKAKTLLAAMDDARLHAPDAAQIVAAECVVDAETKDRSNWELIGRAAAELDGPEAELLQEAYDVVAPDEDEHLAHSAGWARELWLESLGLAAELPPPEEAEESDDAEEVPAKQAKKAADAPPKKGAKKVTRAR